MYMGLAKLTDQTSVSRIRTTALTDHTTSAIHVSELFAPANKFSVVENDDKSFDIVL